MCPALAGRFFTTSTTWEALESFQEVKKRERLFRPHPKSNTSEFLGVRPFPSIFISFSRLFLYVTSAENCLL